MTNILITRSPERELKSQASLGKRTSLPPPLEKYANSSDEPVGTKAFIGCDSSSNQAGGSCLIEHVMNNQIKEFQVNDQSLPCLILFLCNVICGG